MTFDILSSCVGLVSAPSFVTCSGRRYKHLAGQLVQCVLDLEQTEKLGEAVRVSYSSLQFVWRTTRSRWAIRLASFFSYSAAYSTTVTCVVAVARRFSLSAGTMTDLTGTTLLLQSVSVVHPGLSHPDCVWLPAMSQTQSRSTYVFPQGMHSSLGSLPLVTWKDLFCLSPGCSDPWEP